MKHSAYIILILTAFSIHMQAECLYMTIETLHPGEATFAPKAQDILLVNNTATQPEDWGHSTRLSTTADDIELTVRADSLPLMCLIQTADQLQDYGYFRSVSLLEHTQNSGDFFSTHQLTPHAVDSLCALYQVDAIIALNRIAVIDQLSDLYIDDSDSYIAALDVSIVSSWSVHHQGSAVSQSVSRTDTLSWEAESSIADHAVRQLPQRSEAATHAAFYTGTRFVQHILPYWTCEDRYVFRNSNKALRSAYEDFCHRRWAQAGEAFEQILHTEKKVRIRAYAAANAAFCAEILGHIEQAIQLAGQAQTLFTQLYTEDDADNYTYITNYLNRLNIKKNELPELRRQI